jgi:threonylcarbamoyladenosine tRNA methylthiotransferase MtaB
MKYAVLTFGCRVNQADSLRIEEELVALGAARSAPGSADLVIVNTCSVTAGADQGARQGIRRIHRENPRARIVATGCYATRRPGELSSLSGVTHVVANQEKDELVAKLQDAIEQTTAIRYAGGPGACGALLEPGGNGRTAYTLRVQTGCEERCSYCIIPSTRGRGRSLEVAKVVEAARRAADAGFIDITLTGVHLGSYGRDLTPPRRLSDLLGALAAAKLGVLFRVSSLEPMDCTDEALAAWMDGGCFAPHFHLPLQHGCDDVLARMRRPYTSSDYARLLERVRRRAPHAAIGSDFIVGFPGETEEEFERGRRFVEASGLTHLHVFPYSDRPGTAASAMAGKVGGAAIRRRAGALRAVGESLTGRFRASQVGSVRPGLTIETGDWVLTDNYLRVRIAEGRPRGQRVAVRILSDAPGLIGEVVG